MICEKQSLKFEDYLVTNLHKLAQIRDNCSFIELFYLDLNDIYMLKI